MKALLAACDQIVRAEIPASLLLTLEQKRHLCRAATRLITACLSADHAEGQCPYLHGLPSPEPLTPREAEVLWHHARGLAKKEIGAALSISEGTVITHLKTIFLKIGVHSSRAAARWLMQKLGHVLGFLLAVLPGWTEAAEAFPV